MAQVEYWIWLTTRAGSNAHICRALLQEFGSPEAVWNAPREQLARVSQLSRVRLDALADKDLTWAGRIWSDCVRQDITAVTWDDAAYPAPLRQISDAPPLLYVRGTLPDFESAPAVAIVGTRSATPYGLDAAQRFAYTLAQSGCIIVSGMARGIDGAANRAAIDAGGKTVAVLGCGVDVCYPWQHEALMRDIVRHGAVISEYPPGTSPDSWRFPQRNRIITGLCRGTLVVEAPKKSGALISADLALEQGRDVFAIPGDIGRRESEGCNALIRQGGAELVQSPADILAQYVPERAGYRPESVGTHSRPHTEPPAQQLTIAQAVSQQASAPQAGPVRPMRTFAGNAQERTVWRAVRDGNSSVDAIVAASGLSAALVLTALTMLELHAYVIRAGDGYRAADDVTE